MEIVLFLCERQKKTKQNQKKGLKIIKQWSYQRISDEEEDSMDYVENDKLRTTDKKNDSLRFTVNMKIQQRIRRGEGVMIQGNGSMVASWSRA